MRRLIRKFSFQQPTLQDLINSLSHAEREIFQKFVPNHVEPDQHTMEGRLPVPDNIPRPDWLDNPNPVYQRPLKDGIYYYG